VRAFHRSGPAVCLPSLESGRKGIFGILGATLLQAVDPWSFEPSLSAELF
jgi:hypothetical protein